MLFDLFPDVRVRIVMHDGGSGNDREYHLERRVKWFWWRPIIRNSITREPVTFTTAKAAWTAYFDTKPKKKPKPETAFQYAPDEQYDEEEAIEVELKTLRP